MSRISGCWIDRIGTAARWLALALAALLGMAQAGQAAIIYVDANGGIGGNTVRDSNGSATDWMGAASTDNLWFNRTSVATKFGEGDVWETLVDNENAPLLRTTVTGLTNGSYDVYVYFGANNTSSTLWQIQAGLANSSMTQYSIASSGATQLFDDTSFDGWRVKIGTASVSGGSLNVFIDNMADTGSGQRTYYDGIGYGLVPEPSSLALLLLGSLGLGVVLRKRG